VTYDVKKAAAAIRATALPEKFACDIESGGALAEPAVEG
jgi:hypothetical protein